MNNRNSLEEFMIRCRGHDVYERNLVRLVISIIGLVVVLSQDMLRDLIVIYFPPGPDSIPLRHLPHNVTPVHRYNVRAFLERVSYSFSGIFANQFRQGTYLVFGRTLVAEVMPIYNIIVRSPTERVGYLEDGTTFELHSIPRPAEGLPSEDDGNHDAAAESSNVEPDSGSSPIDSADERRELARTITWNFDLTMLSLTDRDFPERGVFLDSATLSHDYLEELGPYRQIPRADENDICEFLNDIIEGSSEVIRITIEMNRIEEETVDPKLPRNREQTVRVTARLSISPTREEASQDEGNVGESVDGNASQQFGDLAIRSTVHFKKSLNQKLYGKELVIPEAADEPSTSARSEPSTSRGIANRNRGRGRRGRRGKGRRRR